MANVFDSISCAEGTIDAVQSDRYRRIIRSLLQLKVRQLVVPENIIPGITEIDSNVLSLADKQQIKRDVCNLGYMAAAAVILFNRLVQHEGWFDCLRDALRDPDIKQAHVARLIEKVAGVEHLEKENDDNEAEMEPKNQHLSMEEENIAFGRPESIGMANVLDNSGLAETTSGVEHPKDENENEGNEAETEPKSQHLRVEEENIAFGRRVLVSDRQSAISRGDLQSIIESAQGKNIHIHIHNHGHTTKIKKITYAAFNDATQVIRHGRDSDTDRATDGEEDE